MNDNTSSLKSSNQFETTPAGGFLRVWRSSEVSERLLKMNHCDIQKNATLVALEEMESSVSLWDRKGPVVCPKPQRVGILSNNPAMSLRFHKRSLQADLCDSKAGAELLDMILMKQGYGAEKSPRELASSPPFFCGSPPTRVSNPLVQDAQFVEAKLTQLSASHIAPPSNSLSPSSSTHKGGCVRMKFGLKPAAVRVEGFDCLSRDHQNSSITAVA
ncbi:hypothetical protein Nepgr_022511 [Nepenthes gracilis]|uniref:Uncharacterized protein n=1 Tax=Nepenthes gracilis TaxID=150966 RepID=A0AAD3XY93_NEPGR|nr:hypothetical protein Nepgr_022511 [Nepenthes gracilis]